MSNCWILTYSGVEFDLLDPTPDMVCIEDIIWSLPRLCRYTGHSHGFYSVAQHCVDAMPNVHPLHMLEWLLHDAHEAYTGDLNGPLKSHCPSYAAIQENIDRVVRERFELPPYASQPARDTDLRMLATEKRDLMPQSKSDWQVIQAVAPYKDRIIPMPEATVRSRFARALYQYMPLHLAEQLGMRQPLVTGADA